MKDGTARRGCGFGADQLVDAFAPTTSAIVVRGQAPDAFGDNDALLHTFKQFGVQGYVTARVADTDAGTLANIVVAGIFRVDQQTGPDFLFDRRRCVVER